MAGPYPDEAHLPTILPSCLKKWNTNATQHEGIDCSTPTSFSIPPANEEFTYSRTSNFPQLSIRLNDTRNPINSQAHSTISSILSESLSSSTNTEFNLQMLIENRQIQKKSIQTEKKDNIEFTSIKGNTNICMQSKTMSPLDSTSKSEDKLLDIDKSTLSYSINTEQSSIDSNISCPLSLFNYNNDADVYEKKDTLLKNISMHAKHKKSDLFKNSNNQQLLENNINLPSRILILSPDVTIEKASLTKKMNESTKDVDESSVTNCTQAIFSAINLTSKSHKILKNGLQEPFSDNKLIYNEHNSKLPKNIIKKGRKGVDSLLEKLENCNKKNYHPDNISSMVASTSIAERDGVRANSVSPEYYKCRSPNSREDDVISPNFSNDDSNDTKLKRKRKLDKPIRLAKDIKSEENEEHQNMKTKLSEKSEIIEYFTESNEESLLEKLMYMQKSTIKSHEFKINEKECNNQIQNKDKKHKNNTNGLDTVGQQTKKIKIDMRHYVFQTLKNTPCRIRRSSECNTRKLEKGNRYRRKSCNDIGDNLQESVPKLNTSNSVLAFNEVESQLEKMFAGIVETDKDLFKKTMFDAEKSITPCSEDEQNESLNIDKMKIKNASVNLTSSIVIISNSSKKKKKNITKLQSSYKKKTKFLKKIDDSNFSNNKKETLIKFNKNKNIQNKSVSLKRKKKSNCKNDYFRDVNYDYLTNSNPAKCRGPVIQIRGHKNNPVYVQIIHASREEDEEKSKEKRKTVSNGSTGRSKRLNYQNNMDYWGKSCNTGLFNTTLSVRYDIHTANTAWICVFCKRGPHFIVSGNSGTSHTDNISIAVLSDLFGPYIIGRNAIDRVISLEEEQLRKGPNKNDHILRNTVPGDSFTSKDIKRKNDFSNNVINMHMGMLTVGDDKKHWEVWLHEQCIIWAAGVFITGGRISGLQDAVWDAVDTICYFCGLSGANIGCTQRGCSSITHYCCALKASWHLDTNQFIPKCNIHRLS